MPVEHAQRAFKFKRMSDKKTYIIITSEDEPIQNISRELKKKGFSIESTLDAIGQIIGKGDAEMKKEALKIKGVKDIIQSHDDINIGQPDSDTTW